MPVEPPAERARHDGGLAPGFGAVNADDDPRDDVGDDQAHLDTVGLGDVDAEV
ncbi:hypothetical protein [Streptosporangium saharense]|uniref:hypothetical protein n=1 Tax=Streptosporangium saharense TaxID=1706840 RepID=UPI0034141F54